MKTVTWRDLVGSDYGPGMAQPVDLTHLNTPAICTKCVSMGSLLDRGVTLGGEPPVQHQQFYGRGAVTAHNVGAAIDIFYNSQNDAKRAFGNALVELFIRFRASLGWGWMAYNRVVYLQSRMEPTDGDPHLDHVHIDWVNGDLTKRSKALASFTYNGGQGIQTKTVGGLGQDISMTTNAAADSAVPSDFVAAFEALCSSWSAASVAHYKDYTRDDFDDAYAGVAAGSDLSWLLGWWDVTDGNPYYYYFDHGGRVVYIETKPKSAKSPAPIPPHNTGTYTFTAAGQLVLQWRPIGNLAATVETFYNATPNATTMNANSSQYAPLAATRMT